MKVLMIICIAGRKHIITFISKKWIKLFVNTHNEEEVIGLSEQSREYLLLELNMFIDKMQLFSIKLFEG